MQSVVTQCYLGKLFLFVFPFYLEVDEFFTWFLKFDESIEVTWMYPIQKFLKENNIACLKIVEFVLRLWIFKLCREEKVINLDPFPPRTFSFSIELL